MTDLSHLETVGLMQYFKPFIITYSFILEELWSTAINLDVIFTILSSFKRRLFRFRYNIFLNCVYIFIFFEMVIRTSMSINHFKNKPAAKDQAQTLSMNERVYQSLYFTIASTQIFNFSIDMTCFFVLVTRVRTINELTQNTKYNLFKIRMMYMCIILVFDTIMLYYITVQFFVGTTSLWSSESVQNFFNNGFNRTITGITYTRGIFIPLFMFIEPIYRQRLVDKYKDIVKCRCLYKKKRSVDSFH